MKTAEQLSREIDLGLGTLCCDKATGSMCHEHEQIALAITAAQHTAVEAVLADAVRLLARAKMVNASKLLEAMGQDAKAMREKKTASAFPALRDAAFPEVSSSGQTTVL